MIKHKYGIELTTMEALRPTDAVILAVARQPYIRGGWPLLVRLLKDGGGIVLDVKSQLDRRFAAARDRSVAAVTPGMDGRGEYARRG